METSVLLSLFAHHIVRFVCQFQVLKFLKTKTYFSFLWFLVLKSSCKPYSFPGIAIADRHPLPLPLLPSTLRCHCDMTPSITWRHHLPLVHCHRCTTPSITTTTWHPPLQPSALHHHPRSTIAIVTQHLSSPPWRGTLRCCQAPYQPPPPHPPTPTPNTFHHCSTTLHYHHFLVPSTTPSPPPLPPPQLSMWGLG